MTDKRFSDDIDTIGKCANCGVEFHIHKELPTKKMKQFISIINFLKPRYKVIADYPGNPYPIGAIGTTDSEYWAQSNYRLIISEAPDKYPHLFKKLEWWEHRTIEELKSVKYVKVITYRGYWRVGDIVPVNSFEGGSMEKALPTGYNLKYNHYQSIFELEPASQSEYESFINQNKQS